LVEKSEESLNRFLNEVKHIGEEAASHLDITSPEELVDALELQNLLLLAELEAVVCLKRTESRGPHYREDFPDQDDENWLKSITVKKVDEGPQVETVSLDAGWKSVGDEKVKQWG
jgi:succinate dehydrogenase/fumarate reductase flavoprotein subunit